MRLEHLLSGVFDYGVFLLLRQVEIADRSCSTRNEFGTIPMVYWGMVSRTTLTALNIGEVALNSTSLSVVPVYRAPENL